MKRVVILADGGDAVAHRAFHHWKRPAERTVAVHSIRCPVYGKVAIHAEVRFLRFQAPWAYGRNVFVLLRRTLKERWANIRYRLMDVAEQWRVRGHIGPFTIRKTMNVEMSVTGMSHRGRWSMDVLLLRDGNSVKQGFYRRLAACLLTNVWY